jgi:hypothetical protein
MAGSIESRLQALERARALPLPLYLLTFTDGSSRYMDALGVLLYMARLDAGAEDKPIRAAERVRGQLPAGTAWRTLESELASHAEQGKKAN